MKSKNIQMPEKFIIDVYKLILALEAFEMPSDIKVLTRALEAQIEAKFERMKQRELYTESKINADMNEREKARREYVESTKAHNNFR